MRSIHTLVAASFLLVTPVLAEEPPTRLEIEEMMGLRSEGDLVRGQLDTVGYPVTAEQAEDLVRTAIEAEGEALATEGEPLVGGICPHDDHLYSARVMAHLSEQIEAPRVVLIGVFHKARLWELHDRLVFDGFQAWHGPWGPVPVDGARDELLAELDEDTFLVDNAMHCREHSLEGILSFLQFRHRDLSIVPILVPYANWDRLQELSSALASGLAKVMQRHGWELGTDIAVVISNDAVHYGPDFDHAPFGTGPEGYMEAVNRDRDLIRGHLEGPVNARNLEQLLYTLVEPEDVRQYKIPWCGRFSVPFGVLTLDKLAAELGLAKPEGRLLRYGTTLSEAEPPISAATRQAGLGFTASSNFHHWVGFMSVGYSLPDNLER